MSRRDLPTKRVGPGGVQKVEPTADYEFLGEEHIPEPEQTIMVSFDLDVWPEARCRGQIIVYRAQLDVRVEYCVGMATSYAQVMAYRFDAPYDDKTEKEAREQIRTGRAAWSRDFEIHDAPHYDRSKPPVAVVISDPYDVLRWLGEDFTASMTTEQQQITDAKKQLPDA